ncbi:hypothetical protein LTR95_005961 [Oleoguttula sp. CCFEE 5521]
MRSSIIAASFAAAASASWAPPANGTAPVYVTDVVTAYTTYCPEATQITHAGQTYTVSSATTLTITNCPGGCTITRPVTSSTPVAPVPYTTPVAPVPYTTPVAPAPVPSGAPPAPPANGTVPVYPTGTAAPTKSTSTPSASPIVPYTGAASKASAGVAGLLAVFGLAALL